MRLPPCLRHAPWYGVCEGLHEHRMAAASGNFFCDKLGIVVALERCRSSHTQIRHTFKRTVPLLVSERTTVTFPLSLTRATVAPARLQGKIQKLVTHVLDDRHSDLYGEREQFLRPPFFQHVCQ